MKEISTTVYALMKWYNHGSTRAGFSNVANRRSNTCNTKSSQRGLAYSTSLLLYNSFHSIDNIYIRLSHSFHLLKP
jgi:hypothetical protein